MFPDVLSPSLRRPFHRHQRDWRRKTVFSTVCLSALLGAPAAVYYGSKQCLDKAGCFATLQGPGGATRRHFRSCLRVGQHAAQAAEGPMAGNRLLHAMLRVRDINETLAFLEAQGMRALSYVCRPNGVATAFAGYGRYADAEHFALELAAGPPPKDGSAAPPVDVGDGLICFSLRAAMAKEGASPDGYAVRPAGPDVSDADDPFCEVCLRVADIDASTKFYVEVLGMVAQDAGAEASLTGGSNSRRLRCAAGGPPGGLPTALVLVAAATQSGGGAAPRPLALGNGLDHFAMSTPDVFEAAKALEDAGVEVSPAPTVMFGINITGTRDPDGRPIYLVEERGFTRRR